MEKRNSRILDIFFRGIRGEQLSIKNLSEEYQVSKKTITRDFNELKNYLAEHRDSTGNAEWIYSYANKTYSLSMDGFLESKELFLIIEILLASRAISKDDLIKIIRKIKLFTTPGDRQLINQMLDKELYHYAAVKLDCNDIVESLWKIARLIQNRKEITIRYSKMDASYGERRILPLAIVFSEYYFYLLAYHEHDGNYQMRYYRIDRIISIVEHRQSFRLPKEYDIDEGSLKKKIHFMWSGENRKIKFEFNGPSVQAILDRIPTARIVKNENGKYLIEADVYGDGIKRFLFSQGEWVKVIEPEALKVEFKEQLRRMIAQYE